MRIPANNKQAVASRRYSYRQRSDEIFVPTGATVVNEIKAVLPDHMDADVVTDKQCVMPITVTTISPLLESGANRSVSSFVVALKKQQQEVADTSSVTDGVNDAINDATDPTDSMSKDNNENLVENQENQFIHTNQKGGNRPYCTSSGSNPNKLGDASSSQTLAERRLQQRSAIFKKGDLENKPSVVNTVLSKKRLNDGVGGGDSANNSVMALTENHRVEPNKPIVMAGKQAWNTKRKITNGVLAPLSQSVNDQNTEKSINVESEESKDTIPSNNKGGTSGGATDFATKLAWAAKLEKRRETFAKKIPSPAHRRQPTKKQCEANISNPEQSGNKDTIASATNVDKQDDKAEKKVVSGGGEKEVAVVEEVYPSPSHLDFSNTKAWAAELAKQKILSDKKKLIDKNQGSSCSPNNKSSLDFNDGGDDSTTNADEQDKVPNRSTTSENKDEKDEFSARLRAKRRQLSEKKRKTSDVVESSDKAEDSVWYDFEIPMAEKEQPQQSVSLSYSGTMDDQSVPLPVSEEEASEDYNDEQEVHPTESNPLTPILLLQEKRILSLEKKRQSYTGNVCGEEENATLKLVDLATSMKTHWMESPAGTPKKKNESEDRKQAPTPPLDLFHYNAEELSRVNEVSDKSIQGNQVESISVMSRPNSECNATDMKSYPLPKKIDLQLSLTSTQQIAFTKILAEYETKLECKSSEIEYLKGEISSQHVQILELLGNAKASEQRKETQEKKGKMRFNLKRWSKLNLSRFH